ncbi:MAG: multicopper oxidase domain-containing protein [Actinomycetota bacterium]|nr:multicopper oxidase domain-containing protein [Actinomycetota bacterium]
MSKDDRSIISWFAFAAAIAALVVAVVGVSNDGGGSASGGGGGSGAGVTPTITVTMTDFAFSPATISIPTGGAKLRLVNEGAALHNFQVPDLGLKSIDVAAGASIDFEIPAQEAGSYKFICPQPGHEGAGMVGTLTVSESAGSITGTDSMIGTGTSDSMTWSQMDALMLKVAQQYPAATVGKGGTVRPPDKESVNEDGSRNVEYTIVAKVVDWEVEPGKVVQAWTYDGVVPAPEIHFNSGDHVKIILKNELPQSTSLHFHGIQVPNIYDGVDPYTEHPTVPGGEHIYEWIAKGPAVGIYHSHHNAQEQIPDGMFGAMTIDYMPIPQKLIDKGYTKVDKRVNMVLNDAGVIGLSLNGKSFPATEPYTLRVGEVMEVHYMNEGLLGHPMHLHQPMGWVTAKDGVPLDEPTPTDTIWVTPGERYTVLYMGMEPGVWAWHCHILTHAETPTGMKYMVTALIVER